MRDPERIKTILSLLEKIWKIAPDLRLGQILVNSVGFLGSDFMFDYFFHYEDDELIEKLEAFLATLQ